MNTATNIAITPAFFDMTLAQLMTRRSMLTILYTDAQDDGTQETYTARLQKQNGQLADCIDCLPQLNGRPSWQVHRSQPKRVTVGELLMRIASAPAGQDPYAFFQVERPNTAQKFVATSVVVAMSGSNWALVAVAMDALCEKTSVYRFPDGSAVTIAGNEGLPFEYIGG